MFLQWYNISATSVLFPVPNNKTQVAGPAPVVLLSSLI